METLTAELERLRDMLEADAEGIRKYMEKYQPRCKLKHKVKDVEHSLRNHITHIDKLLQFHKGGDEET